MTGVQTCALPICFPVTIWSIEIPTQSTSPTTGALTVVGGVGIQGNVNIQGNIVFGGTGTQVGTANLAVEAPLDLWSYEIEKG